MLLVGAAICAYSVQNVNMSKLRFWWLRYYYENQDTDNSFKEVIFEVQ